MINRKDFIYSIVRYILLAIISAVAVFALINRDENKSSSNCLAGSLCNTCGKSRGCTLPQKS
jgi:hypothetical protein